MPEIAETELQQLRAAQNLLEGLWGNQEIGESVRRTAKKINPAISIPDEHPVAVKAMADVAALKEQYTALETVFNDYRSGAEREKAEAKLRNQLGEVQERFHFTDDAMAKTIEIMQQRQLADPEAAALIYRESLPKTPPQGHTPRFFDSKADMYGTTKIDEQWRTLHENPDQFFADAVNEVFAEMPPA